VCGDKAACLAAGYESIAHAPIRARDQLMGTVHLMDRRKGRFSPETITFVESVCPLIGEALQRFAAEAELAESERRFRSMFERHDAAMLLIDPESAVLVDANSAATRFYGCSRQQLQNMKVDHLSPALRETGTDRLQRTLGLQGRVFVGPHRLANGETRMVEVHSSPIQIQSRRLLFSIIHDITERKQLERQVLEISEQERQRVGQDLHDSLGGKLAGAALMSKALARGLAAKGLTEADLAEEIVRSINESIGQTRIIARGLYPAELGAGSLVGALNAFASEIRHRFGVACRLGFSPGLKVQSGFAAMHLFRIVQEAVNNAIRHGHPRHIHIRLARKADQALLEVRNDGTRLPADSDQKLGLGLHTMRYRASVLGGQLTVKGAGKKGVVVSCELPLSSLAVTKTILSP